MQDLEDYRRSRVQDIIKIHEKVIKEYEIASEMIEGICFSSFIS
jgi:argonaute-like protein implicated in RNA metabolism and viral defense